VLVDSSFLPPANEFISLVHQATPIAPHDTHSSFNVFGFTNPVLALEHFRMNAKYYHLVISDVRMPTMNGFEFIKKVK